MLLQYSRNTHFTPRKRKICRHWTRMGFRTLWRKENPWPVPRYETRCLQSVANSL